MDDKDTAGGRRADLLAAALALVGCGAIVVIALWVPVPRAQLILSCLPGAITLAVARLRSQSQR